MEPLLIIGVPGLLGGVLVALVLIRLRPQSESAVGRRLAPPSPTLINMAHIRVDGLGGLGMVAMAATVAIFVPRIRLTIAIALLLGIGLAALLIARRRREGPLPSSNQHPGAHSMFVDDGPDDAAARPSASSERTRRGAVERSADGFHPGIATLVEVPTGHNARMQPTPACR